MGLVSLMVTETGPGIARAGKIHMRESALRSTTVASFNPKKHWCDGRKCEPNTAIGCPPVMVPLFGITCEMLGRCGVAAS